MNAISINREMISGHQQNLDAGRTNTAQRHRPFTMQRDKLWHLCEKTKETNADTQRSGTITQHGVSLTEASIFQQKLGGNKTDSIGRCHMPEKAMVMVSNGRTMLF